MDITFPLTAVAYAEGAVAKFAENRSRPLALVNLAPEGEPSFPSGHVLVVAAVAIAATATDRLVDGAHWLTDFLGSAAMAAVITALVGALLNSPALSVALRRPGLPRSSSGEPATTVTSHR